MEEKEEKTEETTFKETADALEQALKNLTKELQSTKHSDELQLVATLSQMFAHSSIDIHRTEGFPYHVLVTSLLGASQILQSYALLTDETFRNETIAALERFEKIVQIVKEVHEKELKKMKDANVAYR